LRHARLLHLRDHRGDRVGPRDARHRDPACQVREAQVQEGRSTRNRVFRRLRLEHEPLSDEGDPISYQALPRGVPVISADGLELGTVHRVLDNAREHIFDGIVIKTDQGRRFVDAPEVARITDRRVTLTINAIDAADLPEDRGTLGAVETRLQRTSRRWKRRFGR
jgi:hypothetical protein